MAISDLLKGLNKSATPACSANSEKGSTKILDLAREGEMVDWSPPFEDKFGRGHSLSWVRVKNPQTGHLHDALCNLQWWDPHHLQLAKGCRLALEPGSNFSRVCGWERQPEELKQTVIDRLQDSSLIDAGGEEIVEAASKPSDGYEVRGLPADQLAEVISLFAQTAMDKGIPVALGVYIPTPIDR